VYIVALNRFTERGASKVLDYLVPTTDNWINNNRKVFCFFKSSLFSVKNNSEVVAVIYDFVEFSGVEFVIRRHEFYPLGKDGHFATVFTFDLLFRSDGILLFFFFLLFKKYSRVFLWQGLVCGLFNATRVIFKHLGSFLFSESFVLLSVRRYCTCREIELLGELLTTCDEIFFVHYVGVETGIIIIHVLINSFLIHDVQLARIEDKWGLVLEKGAVFFAGLDHRLFDIIIWQTFKGLTLDLRYFSYTNQIFGCLYVAKAVIVCLLRLSSLIFFKQSFRLKLEVVFLFYLTFIQRGAEARQLLRVFVFFHLAVIW